MITNYSRSLRKSMGVDESDEQGLVSFSEKYRTDWTDVEVETVELLRRGASREIPNMAQEEETMK